MSLVSVLANPSYTFQYPEQVNVMETLVLRNLVAYNDENNTSSMLIGATSNVNIEAAENIQMFVKSTGSFDIFTSDASGTRVDTKVLEVSAPNADKTLLATSGQTLEMYGADAQKTTIVGHTTFHTNNAGSNQYIDIPVGEDFYFNNNVNVGRGMQVTDSVVVGKSLLVQDHLITYGNIFGSNLNVWRSFDSNQSINSNVGQVGFGFRINTNQQLELVKYTKFSSKTIAKRVALFGQTRFNESMNNDQGVEFSSISDILGITNLPEMSDPYGATVDLTKPIKMYWGEAPNGIIYTGGYVGISNNAPEFPLDVGGVARFEGLLTEVAVIQQNVSTSDARLKNEIGIQATSDSFDMVNSLRVTKYSFKDDPDNKELVGFMAQEVQDVIPTAVSEGKFKSLDDCKMIDYNQIVANLVGAVQYLSDMVLDLKDRIPA